MVDLCLDMITSINKGLLLDSIYYQKIACLLFSFCRNDDDAAEVDAKLKGLKLNDLNDKCEVIKQCIEIQKLNGIIQFRNKLLKKPLSGQNRGLLFENKLKMMLVNGGVYTKEEFRTQFLTKIYRKVDIGIQERNKTTQVMNPPCLMDWFKTIAYCGVQYIAFCSNGQKWPIIGDDEIEYGLEGAEVYFWSWFESLNTNYVWNDTCCGVYLPMIHTGITFKGGKYPAQWKVEEGIRAGMERGNRCREVFGTGVKPTMFPVWNAGQKFMGGAHFILIDPHAAERSRGILKI